MFCAVLTTNAMLVCNRAKCLTKYQPLLRFATLTTLLSQTTFSFQNFKLRCNILQVIHALFDVNASREPLENMYSKNVLELTP